MFEILIFFIFITFLIIITGIISSRFLLKNTAINLEIYEIGLIGIITLTFTTFLIHFFLPLSKINNSLIFFAILIIFFFTDEKKKINFKKFDSIILSVSILIVLIMTIGYKPNEDYGYYHLPYIINMISDKIIFGLSNIQVNFAWNSSWLNFSSVLNLPLLDIKGTQLSNSTLYFFVLCLFLKESKQIIFKTNISNLFILTSSLYFIIKFSRISEHGFDFPANIFLVLSFFYFLKIFEEDNVELIKKYFVLVLLFSTYCLTIKLSTFMSPLLVLSSFFLIYKKKINIQFIIRPLIFSSTLILFWLVQQFIYSGCFVPFFDFTCFKSVLWHNTGITEAVNSATGAVNKSFSNYSGNLSPEEYVKNFNWVQTWFERNKPQFLDHFVAYWIPILILFFINFKNFFNKRAFLNQTNKKKSIKEFNILSISILLFVLIGLFLWFNRSPVIRFGIPYLLVLNFLILYFILKKLNNNFIFNKGVLVIFVLALVFNITKNLNRIINHESKSYWPEILVFNYSQRIKDNFNVNYPDSNDKYHKKKYCWSIPYICHMGKGNGLNFEKKLSYMIISREEKK